MYVEIKVLEPVLPVAQRKIYYISWDDMQKDCRFKGDASVYYVDQPAAVETDIKGATDPQPGGLHCLLKVTGRFRIIRTLPEPACRPVQAEDVECQP